MISSVITTGRSIGGSQARSNSSSGRSRMYSVRTRGSVVEHPAQIIRYRALQILADMFIGRSEALDSRMGGQGGTADGRYVRGEAGQGVEVALPLLLQVLDGLLVVLVNLLGHLE